MLYDAVDEHLYKLEVEMGLNYNRIMDMEVDMGRKWIERSHDTHMSDKIDFFSAHNIDVLKSDCKVSIYRDWMNRQKDKQYKYFMEKDKDRKKEVKKDADIEDIIKRRRSV